MYPVEPAIPAFAFAFALWAMILGALLTWAGLNLLDWLSRLRDKPRDKRPRA